MTFQDIQNSDYTLKLKYRVSKKVAFVLIFNGINSSSDLTPINFFSFGTTKKIWFTQNIRSLQHLKERTSNSDSWPNSAEVDYRLDQCRAQIKTYSIIKHNFVKLLSILCIVSEL